MQILVVEDEQRMADLLARTLQEEGHQAVVSGNGREGLAIALSSRFDAIVLDVMLPGIDGFSVVRKLRESRNQTPVLMLTARDAAADIVSGLDSGADDYLAKPFEPYELVLRLRAMLRRRAPIAIEPQAHLRIGPLDFDVARAELTGPDGVVHLTGGEAALLQTLARRPGDVFSRDEIVETLRMDEAGERAIDVQVTRLRRKIEADPREPRFLHTVRGRGYVLKPGI